MACALGSTLAQFRAAATGETLSVNSTGSNFIAGVESREEQCKAGETQHDLSKFTGSTPRRIAGIVVRFPKRVNSIGVRRRIRTRGWPGLRAKKEAGRCRPASFVL
jgi:hypothetical protein